MLIRPVQARQKVRVGEVLLQRGLITQAQLKHALALQKQSNDKLGTILMRQGLVTRSQLQQALQEQNWHNAVATALIAISAFVPHLPKLALQVPVAVAQSQHPTVSGTSPKGTQRVGGITQEHQPHGSVVETTVAQQAAGASPVLQAKPTVAQPLQGFCHPLNGLGWLSQGNGGVTHRGRMQFAYDLAAPIGTPVYAMRSGRVIGVEDRYPDTGGGRSRASKFNYVFIKHDGGYRSIYVHLQQDFRQTVSLKAGDWVKAGDLIGFSGNSGWSSGPHLHIEVQKPSKSLRRFTKTVPFAVKGKCTPQTVAKS